MRFSFRWILVIAFLASFNAHAAASNIVSNVDSNRLTWNKRTLVDAYYKVGQTNSAWNQSATNALNAFAVVRSKPYFNKEMVESVAAPCRAAKAARCTDTLVGYLYVRYVSAYQDIDQAEYANALGKAADNLGTSRYPPIRKLYASLRAAEAFKAMGTNSVGIMHHHRSHALRYVTNVVNDSTIPIQEIDDVCSQLIDLLENNARLFDEFYTSVEGPLFSNWPGTWQTWLIKGKYYQRYAWKGRGRGLANAVSEVEWKVFGERLVTARESLEKAWSLNQTDTRIPTEMMVVELGQGKGRKEMELWFERAMKLDTNNGYACQIKLEYLMPKWYGNEKEMLAFGRECVNSTQWGGRVPLILEDVHRYMGNRPQFQGNKDYWKEPGVWTDLKDAYEKFFKLNPEAVGWRHNYARYAYWCEAWGDLNKQLPLLGKVNYEYFGGRAEFDAMVAKAKQHSPAPPATEQKK